MLRAFLGQLCRGGPVTGCIRGHWALSPKQPYKVLLPVLAWARCAYTKGRLCATCHAQARTLRLLGTHGAAVRHAQVLCAESATAALPMRGPQDGALDGQGVEERRLPRYSKVRRCACTAWAEGQPQANSSSPAVWACGVPLWPAGGGKCA